MRSQFKTYFMTFVALIAFAGNSVLCRLALGDHAIDATSFTLIRLASGALSLWLIIVVVDKFTAGKQPQATPFKVSSKEWLSGFMLFIYAAGFSYAYIVLDTGVGALVLFGCVQLTMITVSIFKREKLSRLQWAGLLIAFFGLVYLMDSQHNLSESSVSGLGFLLMVMAGIAWGVYTLLGRGSATPLKDTYRNFGLSLPFCALLSLVYLLIPPGLSAHGIGLALASGVITSGIGYAVWYVALLGLSRIQAGVVQLLVPVFAAIGGLIWASEALTLELIVSQLIILGGIAMVMFTPKTKHAP